MDKFGVPLCKNFVVNACGVILCAAFVFMAGNNIVEARMIDMGQAKKNIIGYGLPWTVRPGETIDFRVSTYAPGDYQADLIRLTSADEFDRGKRFQFDEIKSAFEGSYPGRTQAIHTGSYVQINNSKTLDGLKSFTVVTSIYPTLLPTKKKKGTGGIQHLINRWDDVTKTGWSLALDEEGRVSFYTGDGKKWHKVTIPTSLTVRKWYQISAAYNAETNQITLCHMPLPETPGDKFYLKSGTVTGDAGNLVQKGSLRFGAATGASGNDKLRQAAGGFNGKIDAVRIVENSLNQKSIKQLFNVYVPRDFEQGAIVGFWDFSKGIGTTEVHDLSLNNLHGFAVNLPERAVTGIKWDGSEFNWQKRPAHYSAIYFHDDDVYDLEWKRDFSFKIPKGLKSGIYAARLRLGDAVDHVPFYVAPPKGKVKSKIAFLLPTVSYLAYSNIKSGFNARIAILDEGEDGKEVMRREDPIKVIVGAQAGANYLIERPEMPGGVYRRHSDGTAVKHASRRYPNVTVRPDSVTLTLNADLDIIEWLEHEGFEYDVITDDILQEEGAELLEKYTVVMTGNHPEYVTPEAWTALETYQNQGGRFMYMGGNGFYWVTSFHQQVPDAIEVRKGKSGKQSMRRAYQEFDGHKAGYWWDVGRDPHKLLGIGYAKPMAMEGGGFYRKQPDADNPRARFIFEGIKGDIIGDFGKYAGGAAGEEVDAADFKNGTPPHALILATSENIKWPYDASGDGMVDKRYRLNVRKPRADIVFYETPMGGAVFSVGSMAWRASLNHNNFDNNVSKMTGNVLRRFSDPRPFDENSRP